MGKGKGLAKIARGRESQTLEVVLKGQAFAMTQLLVSSNPEVVGAPVFDCLLKLFGFDEPACSHGANEFFKFLVGRKTEGDYLSGSQCAYLLRERRREDLLIAQFLFEADNSVLYLERISSHKNRQHQEGERYYDPPT